MFAIKIKIYTTSKYSSFFFLYDKQSILFFDENFAKFIEITNSTEKHETRVIKLQHVRLIANEKLLIRVIYANKIRNIRFDLHVSIKIKHWMLMKREKKKIEIKWYNFYKILNYRFLKTYQLIFWNDKVLKNLFDDNKFVKTNVINDDVKIWFSSVKQAEFRKQNKIVESLTSKVQKIFDNDEFLSSIYDELITMTKIKMIKKSRFFLQWLHASIKFRRCGGMGCVSERTDGG